MTPKSVISHRKNESKRTKSHGQAVPRHHPVPSSSAEERIFRPRAAGARKFSGLQLRRRVSASARPCSRPSTCSTTRQAVETVRPQWTHSGRSVGRRHTELVEAALRDQVRHRSGPRPTVAGEHVGPAHVDQHPKNISPIPETT